MVTVLNWLFTEKQAETAIWAQNLDLDSVQTPVNVKRLSELLEFSDYNKEKSQFLINGFEQGFDLGYQGPENVQIDAPNLKFIIGNKTILWNKVMKEVQSERYAGPFESVPFENYIQSPIGFGPKGWR